MIPSASPFPATSTCRPAATPMTAACWRCCREFGIDVEHMALAAHVSEARAELDLCATAQVLAAAPDDTVLLIDGLAYGAFLGGDADRRSRSAIVALVHHPLAFETGIGPERAAKRCSRARRRRWRTREPCHRHEPDDQGAGRGESRRAGDEDHRRRARHRSGPARRRGTGTPLQLLAVGSIVPRKGYTVLVEALRPLAAATGG